MDFYGKTCNYAFPYREEGYEVFFLGDGIWEQMLHPPYFPGYDAAVW